jgi:hypothetical protein
VFPVLALAGGLALLAWNWVLTLSLGLGVGVTVLLYRVQVSPWWLQYLQRVLHIIAKSPQRFLVVSLLGGGLTLGGTYWTAALWQDLHSFWLTCGFGVEGLGILTLLILGLLYGSNRQMDIEADSIDQILTTLRHSDPLQRLQGIYRADRLGQQSILNPEQIQILMHSLSILIQQEAILEVRDTALDTLHRFYDRLNPP